MDFHHNKNGHKFSNRRHNVAAAGTRVRHPKDKNPNPKDRKGEN